MPATVEALKADRDRSIMAQPITSALLENPNGGGIGFLGEAAGISVRTACSASGNKHGWQV